jgi:predicted transcriptional regulator
MKLIDHLKVAGKTVSAFADEVGEAENTIRKIVYGQRQPSLPLAVKIAEATSGAVTESDLLLPVPGTDTPKAAA